jgi:betaine-aldehyde dehydrogenase
MEALLDQNESLKAKVAELEAKLANSVESPPVILAQSSTPSLGVAVDADIRTKQYINGDWVESTNAELIDVVNSNDRMVVGRCPAGSTADAEKAVNAAADAFESFSQTSLEERKGYLKAILAKYTARIPEFVEVLMKELGCTRKFATETQVVLLPAHFGTLLAMIDGFSWEKDMPNPMTKTMAKVVKEPIGVCSCITPWNYPLNQIALKIGPAILSGCTVVLKPSEVTPLCAYLLAECIHDAGLPPGVFNMVVGTGPVVGEVLAKHPRVDMVSFTGSTRAGIRVSELAAQTLKRVRTELGGKSAAVMLDDCDLKESIPIMLSQLMNNTGQSCNALSRMLVPKEKYAEAVKIAKEYVEQTATVGKSEDDKYMGPLVSGLQYDRVTSLIKKGIDEGAVVETGGLGTPAGKGLENGYFVKPTVFSNVNNEMTIARQEIFGPCLSMIPYDDEEDAIRIANDTVYGLNNAVASGDDARADRVARRLRSGQVFVNNSGNFNTACPFGGYKQSGEGREWGIYGMEEFLETKAIMYAK